MKYEIRTTKKFDRDYKRIKRRGYNVRLLEDVVDLLAKGESLPPKYRDHMLSGNYVGLRECHITPDWLLVYRKHEDALVLLLSRTGTHSDLF